MGVITLPLALLSLGFATYSAAEYMYRPSPHLIHYSPKSVGGIHSKLIGSPRHPPTRHGPPPHYISHSKPHHRPRKPPSSLGSSSPWKNSPYKTSKDPFRVSHIESEYKIHPSTLTSPHSSLASSLGSSHSTLSPHKNAIPSLGLSHALKSSHSLGSLGSLNSFSHSILSDDRGPIHTIPAPKLSPADKPSHFVSDPGLLGSHLAFSSEQQAIQSALSQLSSTAGLTGTHQQGYQVTEESSLGQAGHQNHQTLYAPDPDPSRPAPRIKPTTDPHSLPSEGRGPHFSIDPHFGAVSNMPGYVSPGSSSSLAGATLSPQDLFHLLNGFPLQQESYTASDVQHPQLQYVNHVGGVGVGESFGAEQQIQYQPLHFQTQPHPQYQSFNWDEQSYQKGLHHGASISPTTVYQHLEQTSGNQDHDIAEDSPRPTVHKLSANYKRGANENGSSKHSTHDRQVSDTTVSSISTHTPAASASTSSAYLSTSNAPLRSDIRPSPDDGHEDDIVVDDYEDAENPSSHSTSPPQDVDVTPAGVPVYGVSLSSTPPKPQQTEEPDSYSPHPNVQIQSPSKTQGSRHSYRKQPNSVQIVEVKQSSRVPYGTRIRPKRIAQE